MRTTASRIEKALAGAPEFVWTALKRICDARGMDEACRALEEFFRELGLFQEIVFTRWEPRTSTLHAVQGPDRGLVPAMPVHWLEFVQSQLKRRNATGDPFPPFAPSGLERDNPFRSGFLFMVPIMVDAGCYGESSRGWRNRIGSENRVLEGLFILGRTRPMPVLDRVRQVAEALVMAAEGVVGAAIARAQHEEDRTADSRILGLYRKGIYRLPHEGFEGLAVRLGRDVLEVLGFDRCVVYRLDGSGTRLWPIIVFGPPGPHNEPYDPMPARAGIMGRVVETGRQISLPGAPGEWSMGDEALARHTLHGVWLYPILGPDGVDGVLAAFADAPSADRPAAALQGLEAVRDLLSLGAWRQSVVQAIEDRGVQLQVILACLDQGGRQPQTPEQVCGRACRLIADLLGARAAGVVVSSPDGLEPAWVDSAEALAPIRALAALPEFEEPARTGAAPVVFAAGFAPGSPQWKSALAAPVFRDGEICAVLVLLFSSPAPDGLAQRVERILAPLGRALAGPFASLGRRVEEEADLGRIQATLSDAEAMAQRSTLFQIVAELASELFEHDEIFVHLWNPDDNFLELGSFKATDGRVRPKKFLAPEESPLSFEALAAGEAFMSGDVCHDPRFVQSNPYHQIRSLLIAPIGAGPSPVGLVTIQSYAPYVYSADDQFTLRLIAGMAADIYKASRSLAEMLSLREGILENLTAGVAVVDRDGRALAVNRRAEELLGLGAREPGAWGRAKGPELSSLEDRLARAVEQVLASGERAVFAHDVGAEGSRRRLEITVNPFVQAGAGALAVIEDVTARVRAQAQAASVEKLAVFEQVASGIAHEIKNPLNTISAAAQYLQRKFADEPGIMKWAGVIREECLRLEALADKFGFLSRAGAARPGAHVNAAVLEAVDLLDREFEARGVEVVTELDPGLEGVELPGDMLKQMTANILLNSVYAVSDHGKIRVGAGFLGGGEGVLIEIADDGEGIDPDALPRVTEPFFSTRRQGAGLGLSVVARIVESLGGTLEIDSEKGRGTVVRVSLPLKRGER